MRCIIVVTGTADSEAGVMPTKELIAEMGKFNQELIKAGIMKDGAGLKPTSRAKRVRFSGSDRTVTGGPFTPVENQVSGFWIWEVKSLDEAVEWLKRAPMPNGSEVEI